MSSRSNAQSTMEMVKNFLLTPIPLPGLTKPSRRVAGRRAAVRRRGEPSPSAPQAFHITGPLEKGQTTKYAIGGEDMIIDDNTWIFGEFRLGAVANVRGERVGGKAFARKITIS